MWSANFIAALIAIGIFSLIALVLIGWGVLQGAAIRAHERETGRKISFYDEPFLPSKAWIIAGSAVLVVTLICAAGGLYPYSSEYHKYIATSGTVTEVSSRQVASGSSFNQKFVVRFDGSQQEYGCEDTRCALIEPGDDVTLHCIRQWDYNATDGYNCRWGENRGQR